MKRDDSGPFCLFYRKFVVPLSLCDLQTLTGSVECKTANQL